MSWMQDLVVKLIALAIARDGASVRVVSKELIDVTLHSCNVRMGVYMNLFTGSYPKWLAVVCR